MSAIIRKDDLTPEAIELGVWASLLELAGGNPNAEEVEVCSVRRAQ